jgi:hypothetical protein
MGREGNLPALLFCMAGKSPNVAAPSMADPYQAEDDHRTLSRSAEIQADPKRVAGVRKHQAKQKRTLGVVGRMIGSKR